MNLTRVLGDVASKVQTLTWFLARPAMHRELIRRIGTRRFSTPRTREQDLADKQAATEWCRTLARPLEAILVDLGLPAAVERVNDTHPEAWRQATSAYDELGSAMGGPGHIDLLHHVCRAMKPERVLETGVAAGWSSLAILLALEGNSKGRLVSVDMPYPKRGNEHAVGCVVPSQLKPRWELVRRPDRDALPEILPRYTPLDLAHYDSDKSQDGRLFAYPRIWAALRAGGLLISDDVEDNLAFREFAKTVERTPFVIKKKDDNYAGVLVR